ncbi:hypothetical protein Tco_0760348 [Tanacetum coccineum]
MCDVPFRDNSPPLDILKDQFEGVSNSNDDSTSIDDDSFSIDDIDYVEATPPDSELVSLEKVKDFHTEDGEIEDDILREKLSKINLLITKIEAINSNPPPSSDFNSSGSTTTRSDLSLPDYEAFYDNHIEEKSNGSTTTHADFSQYDSFIFDLSINPFPPADRSDFYHEEFAGELAHIISPPEYDCFNFKNEPELGDFTMDMVEDIFPTKEPRVHVLPTHPTLDLDFILSIDSLLAYVVWIFLAFLTYPISPPYLLSCGNEDTIFDPGISVYHSFMPNPRNFYHRMNFLFHPPFPPFLQCLTLCFHFHPKMTTKFSIMEFLLLMRRNLLISYLIGALKLSRIAPDYEASHARGIDEVLRYWFSKVVYLNALREDKAIVEYRIFTKGPNKAKTDKTKHGNGKSVKKSKSTKVKVKDEAENEEILN